jgi:hypothetical protein
LVSESVCVLGSRHLVCFFCKSVCTPARFVCRARVGEIGISLTISTDSSINRQTHSSTHHSCPKIPRGSCGTKATVRPLFTLEVVAKTALHSRVPLLLGRDCERSHLFGSVAQKQKIRPRSFHNLDTPSTIKHQQSKMMFRWLKRTYVFLEWRGEA